ncbi:MAG: cation-transporting P-type ATPase, partial [Pseudanabaena sp.]
MAIETKELSADPSVIHWHSLDADESLKLLQSNAEQGISNQDVAVRFDRYGANELIEKAGRSPLKIFIDQFTNIMLVMLMAVAIVSGFLALTKPVPEFPKDA